MRVLEFQKTESDNLMLFINPELILLTLFKGALSNRHE
jgi:hypothetical protein